MKKDNNEQGRIRKTIKDFRLLDDDFMSRIFDENIECTELILRIILARPGIKVKEVHTQREIKNLLGHSVRLDIAAIDIGESPIDVEVQRAEKGADVKRARYNSSIMDANTLAMGEDYNKLPESYVIFITETDVLGGNLPIYHADRMIAETGNPLGDGSHIIYVNGAYQDDSPLGRLMHDFSCKEPDDMYYSELAEPVRYYKEDVKGVRTMSRIVEELIEEEARETASRLITVGKMTLEEIATCTKLPLDVVRSIATEEKTSA